MKALLSIIAFITLAGTCHKTTSSKNISASKQASNSNCYKARLAVKGICMNYVIEVLDGNMAALKTEKEWKDETDGKTYKNAFALGSRCDFPDLAEGETFYFTLVQKEETGCNVCMAYRPVPAAKNSIVVSKTPCP